MVAGSAPAAVKAAGNIISNRTFTTYLKNPQKFITKTLRISPNFSQILKTFYQNIFYLSNQDLSFILYIGVLGILLYTQPFFYRPVGAFLISLIDITNGFQKIPERLAAKLRRYKEINPDLYKRHYDRHTNTRWKFSNIFKYFSTFSGYFITKCYIFSTFLGKILYQILRQICPICGYIWYLTNNLIWGIIQKNGNIYIWGFGGITTTSPRVLHPPLSSLFLHQ